VSRSERSRGNAGRRRSGKRSDQNGAERTFIGKFYPG
jgi:hypothetical protein